MNKTKFEKLQAIKEEVANVQARLVAARKLEEAAQPSGMATLLENDLDQAELILAAQDMMHKLQNMAEDLAKMNAQDLFPLVDKMKATFGQDGAHTFEASAQEAITNAMNTVRRAKDEMGNSIMRLEGKLPANDMAADVGAEAPAADPFAEPAGDDMSADLDGAMDDFGAADAAAGPVEEPLGRAKKESVEGGKALNESIILEAAGRRLLETESLESLIDWVLNEAAMGMPEDHFKSFASSVAKKAAADPVKLAGWIGKKKKHGAAAMAQLAEPTFTQSADLDIVEGKFTRGLKNAALGATALASVGSVGAIAKKGYDYHRVAGSSQLSMDDYEQEKAYQDAIAQAKQTNEGKTFRKNDDEDDKAERFAARKSARKEKGKGEDALDEGKTFRKGDDEDDKEERFKARKSARKEKQKGEDELEEGKTFRKGNDEDDDKADRFAARKSARREKAKGDEEVSEATLAARSVARLIEASIQSEGKGNAAKFVREFSNLMASKAGLMEGDENATLALVEAFTAEFGASPAAYSVRKLREFTALSTQDQKVAGSAMAKMAGKMGTNKSAANQSVQSAMTGMTGQERNVANKMLNKMKQDGKTPKNAGEFAAAASSELNGDEAVNENINAAHWPVDTMGQYKGEPFSTDYQKLKSNPAGAAKTEGGEKAAEPKADEVGGSKAPEAAEKPKGNPFAKKATEEPKEESTEEKVDEGFKDKLKKAALGMGAAAAMGSAAPAAASPALDKVMTGVKANMMNQGNKEMDDLVAQVTPAPSKKVSINPTPAKKVSINPTPAKKISINPTPAKKISINPKLNK